MDPSENLRMTVIAALMAALIAAGAFIVIPIGPVPIILQNLFVLVTGLLLAPRWATAAIGVYLLAGCAGLPVFAGGTSGIGRLIGPTGGYLAGYVPAVILISLANRHLGRRLWVDLGAMILATLVIYGFGVSWLKAVTAMTWAQTLTVGMLPFLPGDGIKIAAALTITRSLRPIVDGRVALRRENGNLKLET